MKRLEPYRFQPIETQKFIKRVLILVALSLLISIFGILMNWTALIENGGRMPVYTNYYIQKDTHFNFNHPSEVNMFLLTDIFRYDDLRNQRTVWYSLGDVFLCAGLVFVVTVEIYFFARRKNYIFFYY